MAQTFPAVIEGTISTSLSVLPLAFSPFMFIVKYLFGIIEMVILVGVVNGLVVMPALLALLSPLMSLLSSPRQHVVEGGTRQDPPTILAGAPASPNPLPIKERGSDSQI